MKKLLKLIISTMLITAIVFNLGACGKKTPTDDVYKDNDVTVDSNKDSEKDNTESDKEKEEDKQNQEDKQKEQDSTVTVYPYVITDTFGNEITIEKEPQKIVSISPEMTETIFALGLGNKLIGRTELCDYPSEVVDIKSVGTLYEVNTEIIVELNPDIIFVSSLVKEEVVKQLMDNGLTVVTLNWNESFEGVYSYINTIGAILNKKEDAMKYTEMMKEKVDKLVASVEGLEKPTAYFVVWAGESDSTATGDTFLGEMVEMAGAQNIAVDGVNWSYSIEQLIDKDPHIIICPKSNNLKKQIETLDRYKDLTAVKEGRIYEVDDNLYFRQGPRLVEGLAKLIEVFHPEVLDKE
jgi:iron complex transport system substrate-binding protein